ncbi:uncharacterized protein LOC126295258 isoform X3 [Schistocerca gregaria]|uniref:uncharacterized protein LOC126295258 isoform X3 n=1 Tax=Schistocerca gregaria TaxID=7010 RepID=UPI00211DCB6C|nr:uncharacterized protein LOC126295258 isoform X3 [Schistocerca gregaria]
MDVRKEGDSLRCSVPLEKVPQFDAAAVVQAADADKSELKKFQFRMEPTHRTPKGFLCEVCSTVYKRSFSLKRHYLRCHVSVCYLSERDVANCGIANPSKAGAPLSYAKAPGNVECPGMYRCHTCGDWFDDRLTGLRPHLLDHPQPTAAPPTDAGKGTNSKPDTNGARTGAEVQGDLSSAATIPSGADVAVQPKVEIVPRFLCLYCDKRFVTGPLCRRHQRRVHIARENAVRQKLSAAATPAASEANASKGAVASKGAAAGKEPVAGKEVAISKEVPASKEAAAGETKPGAVAEAPDATAAPVAKKEARPRQPRPHQCPYCAGGGTVFKELAALVRHYRRRHADRYHVCAPCATRFPTRDELEAHGVEKHGRRPRSFRAEARAAAKVPRIPPAVPANTCAACAKTFSTAPNLTRHVRVAHPGAELPRPGGEGAAPPQSSSPGGGGAATARLSSAGGSSATSRSQSPVATAVSSSAGDSDYQTAGSSSSVPGASCQKQKKIKKLPVSVFTTTTRYGSGRSMTEQSSARAVEVELAFFSRVSDNIRYNLLHHLDGKLECSAADRDVKCVKTAADERRESTADVGSAGGEGCPESANSGANAGKIDTAVLALPTVRKAPTSFYLSRLDISTQLAMGRSMERPPAPSPPRSPSPDDVPLAGRLARSCAARDRIATDVDFHAGLNLVRNAAGCSLSVEPSATRTVNEDTAPVGERAAHPLSTSAPPTPTEKACGGGDMRVLRRSVSERVVAEETAASTLSPEDGRGLVLSGEWVRPRSYVCIACSRTFPDLCELEEHHVAAHPNVICTHFELEGQSEMADGPSSAGLTAYDLCRRHLGAHCAYDLRVSGAGLDKPEEGVRTRADVHKEAAEKKGTSAGTPPEPRCTKCGRTSFFAHPEFHRHILECGGDTMWLSSPGGTGANGGGNGGRRRRKWRTFGSRRRRGGGGAGRGGYRRSAPATPTQSGAGVGHRGSSHSGSGRHFLSGHHHRNRHNRHLQHQHHRHLHRKAGDGDTIRRMLANLPAKRSTRRMIQFDDIRTRTRTNILMQAHLNRYKHLNRRIVTNASCSYGLRVGIQTPPSVPLPSPPPPQPATKEERRRPANVTRGQQPPASAPWEAARSGSPLARSTTPAGRRSRSLLLQDVGAPDVHRRRSSLPPPERPETPSRNTRQALQKASSEKVPLPLLDSNQQGPTTRNRSFPGPPPLPPPAIPELLTPQTGTSRPQTPRPKTPISNAQLVTTRAQTPRPASPVQLPKLRTPVKMSAPKSTPADSEVPRTQSPSPRRGNRPKSAPVPDPRPQKSTAGLPHVPVLRSRASRLSLDLGRRDAATHSVGTPPSSPAKVKKSVPPKGRLAPESESEEENEMKLHQTRSRAKQQTGVPECGSHSTDILQAGNAVPATKGTEPMIRGSVVETVDPEIHKTDKKTEYAASDRDTEPLVQASKQKVQKGKSNKKGHSESNDVPPVSSVVAPVVVKSEDGKPTKGSRNKSSGRASDNVTVINKKGHGEPNDGLPAISVVAPDVKSEDVKSTKGNRSRSSGRAPDNVTLTPEEGGADVKTVPKMESSPNRKKSRTLSKGKVTSTTVSTSNSSRMSSAPEGSECDSGNVKTRQGVELEALQCIKTEPVDDVTVEDLTRLVTAEKQSPVRKVSKSKKPLGETKVVKSLAESVSDVEVSSRVIAPATKHGGSSRKKESSRPKSLVSKKENVSVSDTETRVAVVVKCVKNNSKSKKPQLLEKIENAKVDIPADVESLPSENIVLSVDEDTVNDDDDDDADADDDDSSESDDDDSDSEDDDSEEGELISRTRSERNPDGTRMFTVTHRLRAMPIIRFKPKSIKKVSKKNVQESPANQKAEAVQSSTPTCKTPDTPASGKASGAKKVKSKVQTPSAEGPGVSEISGNSDSAGCQEGSEPAASGGDAPAPLAGAKSPPKKRKSTPKTKSAKEEETKGNTVGEADVDLTPTKKREPEILDGDVVPDDLARYEPIVLSESEREHHLGGKGEAEQKLSKISDRTRQKIGRLSKGDSPEGSTDWRLSVDSVSILLPEMDSNADLKVLESKNQKLLLDSSVPTTLGEVSVTAESSVTTPKLKGVKLSKKKKTGRQKSLLDSSVVATAELGNQSVLLPYPLDSAAGDSERKEKDEVVTDAIVKASPTESEALNQKKTTSVTNSPIKRDPVKTTLEGIDGDEKSTLIFCDTVQKALTAEVKIVQRKRTSSLTDLTAEIDTPLSATGGVVECNVTETGHKEISENNRKKQQNKTKTKQKRSASAAAVVEKLEPRTSTSVSVERVVTVADVTDLIADGSGKSPSKSKLKRRRTASASKASESQTALTDDMVKVVDSSIGAIAKSVPDTFKTSKQKKTSSTENLTERSDTGAPVVSDLLEQNSQVFPESPAVDFSEKIVPSKPKTSKRKRNYSVTMPVPTSQLVADAIDSEVIHSVKEDTTEHSTNERTPNGIDSVKEDVGTLPENSGHKSASVKISATSDSMLSLTDSGKENRDVTGEAINIAAKSMPSTSKKRRNASSARKTRRSTSVEVPVPECGATVADAAMCADTENEELLEPRTRSLEVSFSDSESGVKEHGKLEVSTLSTVIPNGSPVSADEVHSEKGLILAAMKVAMMGAEVRPSATVDDSENVHGSSGGGKTVRTGTGQGTTRSEADGRNLCDDRRKVCRQCGRDFTSNSSFWKHIQRHCTSPCRVTLAPVLCSDVGGPLQVVSGPTGRVNDVSNSADEVRLAVGDSDAGICTVVADIAKDGESAAEVKNTEDGKVSSSGDCGLDGEDANIFVPESVEVSKASSTGITTEGEQVQSTHVKEVNDEAPETYEVSAERPDSRVSEDADEMPLARLLTGERAVSPEVCNLQENERKSDYQPCSVTSEDAEKALSVAYRVEAGGRICLTISSSAVTGKMLGDTVSSVATDVRVDVSQGVASDESLSSSEDKDSGTKELGSTEESETVEESSERDLSDTSKSDGVGDFNEAITPAEIGEEDLPGRPKVDSVGDSDGVVTRKDDLPGSSKGDSIGVSDSVVTQSVSSATIVVASEGDSWRSLADVTEAAPGLTERKEVEAADGSVEKAADEEPPPDGNVSSDCLKNADRDGSNLDPVIEPPEQTAVASPKRKNKKQERQHWAAASISLQTNSDAPAVTADPEPLKNSSKKIVNARKAEHARLASQGWEGSGSGTSEGEEDVPLSSLLRTVKESRKVDYEEPTEVRQENVEGQLNVSTVVSCTPDVTRGRLPRSGEECAAAAEEACHTSSLTKVEMPTFEKCATESGGITVDSAGDHEEVATVCSVEKSSKEVADFVSTDVIREFQIPSEAKEVRYTSSEYLSSKRKRASEEDKDDCLITGTVAAAICTKGGVEANSVADIQPFKVAKKDVPIDSTCPEDENAELSILVNENARLGLAGNGGRPASYDSSSEFEEGTGIEMSAVVRLSDEVTSRRVDTPEAGAEYANVPEVTAELVRTSLAQATAEQNSGEVAVLSHGSFECVEPADTLQISDDQSVVDLTPEEIQNLLPPLHTSPKMDSDKFGNTPLDTEDLTACFNAPSETLPDPEFLFSDLPVPVHSSNTCDRSVRPEVNVDGVPTVDGPEAAARLPITDRLEPDFSISIPECGDTTVGSGEENAEDILIGGLLPHGEEEVSEVNVNIAGGLPEKEVEPPAKGEGQYGDEEERTSEKNDEQFVYHSECAAVESTSHESCPDVLDRGRDEIYEDEKRGEEEGEAVNEVMSSRGEQISQLQEQLPAAEQLKNICIDATLSDSEALVNVTKREKILTTCSAEMDISDPRDYLEEVSRTNSDSDKSPDKLQQEEKAVKLSQRRKQRKRRNSAREKLFATADTSEAPSDGGSTDGNMFSKVEVASGPASSPAVQCRVMRQSDGNSCGHLFTEKLGDTTDEVGVLCPTHSDDVTRGVPEKDTKTFCVEDFPIGNPDWGYENILMKEPPFSDPAGAFVGKPAVANPCVDVVNRDVAPLAVGHISKEFDTCKLLVGVEMLPNSVRDYSTGSHTDEKNRENKDDTQLSPRPVVEALDKLLGSQESDLPEIQKLDTERDDKTITAVSPLASFDSKAVNLRPKHTTVAREGTDVSSDNRVGDVAEIWTQDAAVPGKVAASGKGGCSFEVECSSKIWENGDLRPVCKQMSGEVEINVGHGTTTPPSSPYGVASLELGEENVRHLQNTEAPNMFEQRGDDNILGKITGEALQTDSHGAALTECETVFCEQSERQNEDADFKLSDEARELQDREQSILTTDDTLGAFSKLYEVPDESSDFAADTRFAKVTNEVSDTSELSPSIVRSATGEILPTEEFVRKESDPVTDERPQKGKRRKRNRERSRVLAAAESTDSTVTIKGDDSSCILERANYSVTPEIDLPVTGGTFATETSLVKCEGQENIAGMSNHPAECVVGNTCLQETVSKSEGIPKILDVIPNISVCGNVRRVQSPSTELEVQNFSKQTKDGKGSKTKRECSKEEFILQPTVEIKGTETDALSMERIGRSEGDRVIPADCQNSTVEVVDEGVPSTVGEEDAAGRVTAILQAEDNESNDTVNERENKEPEGSQHLQGEEKVCEVGIVPPPTESGHSGLCHVKDAVEEMQVPEVKTDTEFAVTNLSSTVSEILDDGEITRSKLQESQQPTVKVPLYFSGSGADSRKLAVGSVEENIAVEPTNDPTVELSKLDEMLNRIVLPTVPTKEGPTEMDQARCSLDSLLRIVTDGDSHTDEKVGKLEQDDMPSDACPATGESTVLRGDIGEGLTSTPVLGHTVGSEEADDRVAVRPAEPVEVEQNRTCLGDNDEDEKTALSGLLLSLASPEKFSEFRVDAVDRRHRHRHHHREKKSGKESKDDRVENVSEVEDSDRLQAEILQRLTSARNHHRSGKKNHHKHDKYRTQHEAREWSVPTEPDHSESQCTAESDKRNDFHIPKIKSYRSNHGPSTPPGEPSCEAFSPVQSEFDAPRAGGPREALGDTKDAETENSPTAFALSTLELPNKGNKKTIPIPRKKDNRKHHSESPTDEVLSDSCSKYDIVNPRLKEHRADEGDTFLEEYVYKSSTRMHSLSSFGRGDLFNQSRKEYRREHGKAPRDEGTPLAADVGASVTCSTKQETGKGQRRSPVQNYRHETVHPLQLLLDAASRADENGFLTSCDRISGTDPNSPSYLDTNLDKRKCQDGDFTSSEIDSIGTSGNLGTVRNPDSPVRADVYSTEQQKKSYSDALGFPSRVNGRRDTHKHSKKSHRKDRLKDHTSKVVDGIRNKFDKKECRREENSVRISAKYGPSTDIVSTISRSTANRIDDRVAGDVEGLNHKFSSRYKFRDDDSVSQTKLEFDTTFPGSIPADKPRTQVGKNYQNLDTQSKGAAREYPNEDKDVSSVPDEVLSPPRKRHRDETQTVVGKKHSVCDNKSEYVSRERVEVAEAQGPPKRSHRVEKSFREHHRHHKKHKCAAERGSHNQSPTSLKGHRREHHKHHRHRHRHHHRHHRKEGEKVEPNSAVANSAESEDPSNKYDRRQEVDTTVEEIGRVQSEERVEQIDVDEAPTEKCDRQVTVDTILSDSGVVSIPVEILVSGDDADSSLRRHEEKRVREELEDMLQVLEGSARKGDRRETAEAVTSEQVAGFGGEFGIFPLGDSAGQQDVTGLGGPVGIGAGLTLASPPPPLLQQQLQQTSSAGELTEDEIIEILSEVEGNNTVREPSPLVTPKKDFHRKQLSEVEQVRPSVEPRAPPEVLSDAEDDLPLSLSVCLGSLPQTTPAMDGDVPVARFGPATPSGPPVLQPCTVDGLNGEQVLPLLPAEPTPPRPDDRGEVCNLDEKLGPPTLDLIAAPHAEEVVPVKEGEPFSEIPVLSPAPAVAEKEILDIDRKNKHEKRSRRHSECGEKQKHVVPPISIKITLPIADIADPPAGAVKSQKKKERKKHKKKENLLQNFASDNTTSVSEMPKVVAESGELIQKVEVTEDTVEEMPPVRLPEVLDVECADSRVLDSDERLDRSGETVFDSAAAAGEGETVAETARVEPRSEPDAETDRQETTKSPKKKQSKSPQKRRKDGRASQNTEDADEALARTISAPRPRRLAKEVALKEVRNHFLIDGQLEALIGANVEDELSLLAVDSALFGVTDRPEPSGDKNKQDKTGSGQGDAEADTPVKAVRPAVAPTESVAADGRNSTATRTTSSSVTDQRGRRKARADISKTNCVTEGEDVKSSNREVVDRDVKSEKATSELTVDKISELQKVTEGAEEQLPATPLKRACSSPGKSPEPKKKVRRVKAKSGVVPITKLEILPSARDVVPAVKSVKAESQAAIPNADKLKISLGDKKVEDNCETEHKVTPDLTNKLYVSPKECPTSPTLPKAPHTDDRSFRSLTVREKRSTRCNLSYEEMYTSSDVTSETDNSQELPAEAGTGRVPGSGQAALPFPPRASSDDSDESGDSDGDDKQRKRKGSKKKVTTPEAGTSNSGVPKRRSSTGSSKFYCAACDRHFTTAYNLAKHARSNRHVARAMARLPMVGVEQNPGPSGGGKLQTGATSPRSEVEADERPQVAASGVGVGGGVAQLAPTAERLPATAANATSADSSLADVAEESEGEILRNQESGWERRVSIHMSLCEILRAKGDDAVKDPATPLADSATATEITTAGATRADSVASSADDPPLSTSDDTTASFKVRDAEAVPSDTGSVWPSPATTTGTGGGEDSPAPPAVPPVPQPPPAATAADGPVSWHPPDWPQAVAWSQRGYDSPATTVPPPSGPWPDADSAPWASVTPPLPHQPTEQAGCWERGAEVAWGGAAARDAWGRPLQPAWERESGTGLDSFMDSFSQSLQILGSRNADDAAGVGTDAGTVPPDASTVALPYPVADPAGLRELQNAMGATDEEMAILQQLGGAGPIWVPIKAEASASVSAPEEEEEEEEADIVDLDHQRTAPEASPADVTRRGGDGAAVLAGAGGEAPTGIEKAVPDTSARRGGVGGATTVAPVVGSVKRQYGMRPSRGAGSSVENLLAAYEAKEMVCPSCHRFFLGVSALQQHVRVAHDGRVGPPPLKKSRASVAGSSVSKRPGGSIGWPVTSGTGVAGAGSGSSESGAAAAASALGTSADSPRRLACPHCRELLAGKDALAAHVAEEHPASMTTTGSATSTTPLGCSDEAEGLKTHISTALGGLLDRALNNLLERGLSPGLNQPTLSLLQKLTARRPATSSASGSSTTTGRPAPVYNTELAKEMRRQISKPRPAGLALLRATSSAVGMSDSHPYVCFYCESRFEQQSTRNRHMVRTHKNEMICSKSKQAEPENDPDDASGGEDSDHSWREPSPTNWTSETPGGDMGGDGDFLCSDCGINFSTPQEVLAHRKAEHSRPEPPPQESSPAQGRGRNGRGRGGAASGRAAPVSPPDGETIKRQAMAALRELGAQSRRGGGRGASQAKWGMRFPLAPASGTEGAVKLEKGAAFSLPLVRKASGPGPRFASLERKRGKKAGAGSGGDEASPGPSPARLDVYEFADEETLAERPELQRRPAGVGGAVVATPDTPAGATSTAELAEEKENGAKTVEQTATSELSKEEAVPRSETAGGDAVEGDQPSTGRPQRRERRRKSCADFPSDLSDVLDESDSDGEPRATPVARVSAAPRGGRRPRRGAGRGGPGRGGAGSARRRGRGRGGGGGRRPAHTALAVTGAAPPAPVAISASSDDDEGEGPALPPAKVPCRATTPDDSSQSSCDVKGAVAGPVGAAARRRRRRAKSDLLISVFRAKARHVSVSAAAGADSSEDGTASGGVEPPV